MFEQQNGIVFLSWEESDIQLGRKEDEVILVGSLHFLFTVLFIVNQGGTKSLGVNSYCGMAWTTSQLVRNGLKSP